MKTLKTLILCSILSQGFIRCSFQTSQPFSDINTAKEKEELQGQLNKLSPCAGLQFESATPNAKDAKKLIQCVNTQTAFEPLVQLMHAMSQPLLEKFLKIGFETSSRHPLAFKMLITLSHAQLDTGENALIHQQHTNKLLHWAGLLSQRSTELLPWIVLADDAMRHAHFRKLLQHVVEDMSFEDFQAILKLLVTTLQHPYTMEAWHLKPKALASQSIDPKLLEGIQKISQTDIQPILEEIQKFWTSQNPTKLSIGYDFLQFMGSQEHEAFYKYAYFISFLLHNPDVLMSLSELVADLQNPIACLNQKVSAENSLESILDLLSNIPTEDLKVFIPKDMKAGISLMTEYCDMPLNLEKHYATLEKITSLKPHPEGETYLIYFLEFLSTLRRYDVTNISQGIEPLLPHILTAFGLIHTAYKKLSLPIPTPQRMQHPQHPALEKTLMLMLSFWKSATIEDYATLQRITNLVLSKNFWIEDLMSFIQNTPLSSQMLLWQKTHQLCMSSHPISFQEAKDLVSFIYGFTSYTKDHPFFDFFKDLLTTLLKDPALQTIFNEPISPSTKKTLQAFLEWLPKSTQDASLKALFITGTKLFQGKQPHHAVLLSLTSPPSMDRSWDLLKDLQNLLHHRVIATTSLYPSCKYLPFGLSKSSHPNDWLNCITETLPPSHAAITDIMKAHHHNKSLWSHILALNKKIIKHFSSHLDQAAANRLLLNAKNIFKPLKLNTSKTAYLEPPSFHVDGLKAILSIFISSNFISQTSTIWKNLRKNQNASLLQSLHTIASYLQHPQIPTIMEHLLKNLPTHPIKNFTWEPSAFLSKKYETLTASTNPSLPLKASSLYPDAIASINNWLLECTPTGGCLAPKAWNLARRTPPLQNLSGSTYIVPQSHEILQYFHSTQKPHPNKVLKAHLNFVKLLGEKNASSTISYTAEDIKNWFWDRAHDYDLITYYHDITPYHPLKEPELRVKLVNGLDLLELVMVNVDFQLTDFLPKNYKFSVPSIIHKNYGLMFLSEYAEVPLTPYAKNLSILDTTEQITRRYSTFLEKNHLSIHRLLEKGLLEDLTHLHYIFNCAFEQAYQKPEAWLKEAVQRFHTVFLHIVEDFFDINFRPGGKTALYLAKKAIDFKIHALFKDLVPYRHHIAAKIHNLTQVAKILYFNSPGYQGPVNFVLFGGTSSLPSYPSASSERIPYHHPVTGEGPGGLEFLIPLFAELYHSTPLTYRNPQSGKHNHLHLVLKYARMGLLHQIGSMLQSWDRHDPRLTALFEYGLASLQQPINHKTFDLLLKDAKSFLEKPSSNVSTELPLLLKGIMQASQIQQEPLVKEFFQQISITLSSIYLKAPLSEQQFIVQKLSQWSQMVILHHKEELKNILPLDFKATHLQQLLPPMIDMARKINTNWELYPEFQEAFFTFTLDLLQKPFETSLKPILTLGLHMLQHHATWLAENQTLWRHALSLLQPSSYPKFPNSKEDIIFSTSLISSMLESMAHDAAWLDIVDGALEHPQALQASLKSLSAWIQSIESTTDTDIELKKSFMNMYQMLAIEIQSLKLKHPS